MIESGPKMTAKMNFTAVKGTQRYRPRFINTVKELEVESNAMLGPRNRIFNLSGQFVTFGSCFATNVAEALSQRGARVFTACITEDVNCPFNNRLLLRRVFLGENSEFTDDLKASAGVDYEQMAREFASATDVIFTLGNIFRNAVPADYELVIESYQETKDCIAEIISLLRSHTKANLYVSVSPIPISGYRGSAFLSVYEADCASKCQLRAALRELDGYTYIPTFEIFRWLSAHQSFATFGADNGNRRHIFPEQISAVIGLLCAST